ncbi:SagB family peptide dehydrogenase [Alicyclobacillus fodiniaquatilis]|uniref:SagB family peptide dehydrogenase n=1 Tax=Alicyclobacillus fodiniaquatilis TaxID=1661150 RepID=A0ABW4JKE6_9BACL
MQLDEFLHHLHFDTDKVRPVDLVVDWADAPLPYKLYQDLPVTSLSAEVPVSLHAVRSQESSVGIEEIGGFLWYSYGLTQLCHTLFPLGEGEKAANVMQMLRRYVPSGGALYPSELYAYLKLEGLAPGIYHYDVAHHRLVCLREGNFDRYLARALGHRCDMTSCFGALFVSTMFWKNFYKYNNFAYRLQGLDAGALIGQLLEVAKQCGYAAFVDFQFLDRAINHLLGLCDEEESVYAVVPLALADSGGFIGQADLQGTSGIESADVLCRELAELPHKHYVKSKKITGYPLLIKMNEAAMMHSTQAFTYMPKAQQETGYTAGPIVNLPNEVQSSDWDFIDLCRQRYSPGLDFIPGGVGLAELSALLAGATSSCGYGDDLALANETCAPRLAMAGCVHGVDGLEDGAYIYDHRAHGLRLLRAGDHRMHLQLGMSMPTVNLFQAPLCLHVVGCRDFYRTRFGYRGYRIQQMEVGMLLQRLLLAAAALGMGGHPLLGYDEGVCDDIYDFGQQGRTCLIQVPMGFYRKTSRFEGLLWG